MQELGEGNILLQVCLNLHFTGHTANISTHADLLHVLCKM